jgi:ketosteroid isomerase-like protein
MVRFGERILVSMAATFFLTAPLFTQEWSAEQKEAWAFEVAYWKASAAGDAATALSYMHDSYRGWNYADAVPGTKETSKAGLTHFATTTKTFFYNPTPLAILVHGDTAVVHYVIASHGTNEKGEHESTEDRWTDTLVKEGGKWMLFGDHGGPKSMLK